MFFLAWIKNRVNKFWLKFIENSQIKLIKQFHIKIIFISHGRDVTILLLHDYIDLVCTWFIPTLHFVCRKKTPTHIFFFLLLNES